MGSALIINRYRDIEPICHSYEPSETWPSLISWLIKTWLHDCSFRDTIRHPLYKNQNIHFTIPVDTRQYNYMSASSSVPYIKLTAAHARWSASLWWRWFWISSYLLIYINVFISLVVVGSWRITYYEFWVIREPGYDSLAEILPIDVLHVYIHRHGQRSSEPWRRWHADRSLWGHMYKILPCCRQIWWVSLSNLKFLKAQFKNMIGLLLVKFE